MTGMIKISITKIVDGNQQTRTYMNPDRINELADDIKKNGLLQPITVRPNIAGYEIICGHRRFEAHKKIGAKNIDCIIRDVDDFDALLMAVRENEQREDLSPFDEFRTYQKFLDMGISQRELAKMLCISQTKISQALNMNRLPDCVEEAVISQLISPTHAQELLKLVRFMDDVGYDEISKIAAVSYKIDDIICYKQSAGDLRYAIDSYICGFIDSMLIMSPERVVKSRKLGSEWIETIRNMQGQYKEKIPFKYIEMAFKFHAKHGDFGEMESLA